MTSARPIVIASALAGIISSADARELTFSIGHPPQSYFARGGQVFAEALAKETKGSLTARVFVMSLLSMAETSPGVREGLADMGAVMIPYHGAEYPHTNLILDASMMLAGYEQRGAEGIAYAAAVTEFIITRCPECVDEFARQKQVYLGGAGSSLYALNCARPLVTLEELKGARLRVGGANWARWAEALGAVPVTIAGNEMLEALSQGLLDCVVLSISDVEKFGLSPSITHISTDTPGGVYIAAFANMNRDTWLSLSTEERRALLKAVAKGAAYTNWSYQQGQVEVLASFEANGGTVRKVDQAVTERTRAFIEHDVENVEGIYVESGVKRGKEMLGDFRAILEKWLNLTQGIDSLDTLEVLYWDELYSKVDVEMYGHDLASR